MPRYARPTRDAVRSPFLRFSVSIRSLRHLRYRRLKSLSDNGHSKEMPMISLNVNGRRHNVDVSPEMPLLWVLRDTLGLTGTKFGCGLGQCGACTVHVDGAAVRACMTAVSTAVGKKITTIEGLSPTSTHPLQVAWVAEQGP